MATIAFYKGTRFENPKARVLDRLICWWMRSRGRFSHCELVEARVDRFGYCWAASARDREGVRRKLLDLGTGRWVLVRVPGWDHDGALRFAAARAGAPYDWFGIASFVLTFIPQVRGWHYCSELIALAVGLVKTHRVSPSDLFAIAQAQPGAEVFEVSDPEGMPRWP